MRILQKLFLSMGSAVVMVALFAIAIATATFIENDYGPAAARVLIYEAKWFEIIILLLGLNLIANIVKHKLWTKGKRPIMVFHAALIFIYLGAALTRYAGYEGTMHIREGQNVNFLLSEDPSLSITLNEADRSITRKTPLLMTPLTRSGIRETVSLNDRFITVDVRDYIPNASRVLVEDEYGDAMVALTVFLRNGREDIILKENEVQNVMNMIFAYGAEPGVGANRVQISRQNGQLTLRAGRVMTRMSMQDRNQTTIRAGRQEILRSGWVYTIDMIRFALKDFKEKAIVRAVRSERGAGSGLEALVVGVTTDGVTRELSLFGGTGVQGESVELSMAGVEVSLEYGSSTIPLPFSLTLVDFEVGRYPGSMKPSSFSSDVIIMDEAMGMKEPFKIYMNHILRHRGFRFFQSDFDPDEKGTILSVSHDPGTPVAYAGFIIMMIALLINVVQRGSRYRKLGKKLASVPALWVLVVFFFSGIAFGQGSARRIQSLTQGQDQSHINEIAKLLVQDGSGRIKPVSSLAHEFAHDLTGSPHTSGAHPVSVVFSMWTKPEAWRDVPLFKVEHSAIREGLGLSPARSHATLNDLYLKSTGQYRLGPAVQKAQQQSPGRRLSQDREILRLDERVKTVESVLDGSQFRIFPLAGHPSQRWTHAEDRRFKRTREDSIMVAELITGYRDAVKLGRWDEADIALLGMQTYQLTYGDDIIPRDNVVTAEVLYNDWHTLERLAPVTLIIGIVMLALTLLPLFKKGLDFRVAYRILLILLLCTFALQTMAFIMRWIAAQHAPWSNKYESMIYIGWATLLAGLFFGRRSTLALGSAALWNGIILLVAHMAWMDPQITNLPPVLKSYWLVIHVSVITSSYGFFGLAAIVSSILLILFIFKDKKTESVMEPLIQQSSWINERVLTIGLILIAVGNIFGAIWANESWGRYWGWDPKETWTLIVILTYTIVLHLRYIPKMRRVYLFHVMTLLAFGTIMMTYFGVNFYLSGLHSYASGDPVPVPWFVYADVVAVGTIVLLGFKNYRLKYENSKTG